MYRPVKVIAQNLFSFKDVEFNFNNGVTTLVNGENNDNESQKSNGSGKSSLIELAAIAICGVPLRKVKNDEIINDEADTAFLRMELQNDVLNEVFVIERTFSRKKSQIISLSIIKEGKEVEEPSLTHLSSVMEYNKAILDRIGMTQDEVFNTFILSKHRHKDFFIKSDTEKKAIINQFSRGNAIDQAIEKIKTDTEPFKEALDKAELVVSKTSGKLESSESQLEEEKRSIDKKAVDSKDKIADLKDIIRKSRKDKREAESLITSIEVKIDKLQDVFDRVDGLDSEGKMTTDEVVEALVQHIEDNKLDITQSFKEDKAKISNEVTSHKAEIKRLKADMEEVYSIQEDLVSEIATIKDSNLLNTTERNTKISELNKRIESISSVISQKREEFKSVRKLKREYEGNRQELLIKLKGKVTCPACKHEFLVSEVDFDVTKGKKDVITLENKASKAGDSLIKIEADGDELKKQKASLDEDIDDIEEKYEAEKRKLDRLEVKLSKIDINISKIKMEIKANNSKILGINDKIDAFIEKSFDKVLDFIEKELSLLENNKKKAQNDISHIEGSIENTQNRITLIEEEVKNGGAIKSIEASIVKYKKELISAKKDLITKQGNLDMYIEQTTVFVDYKAYLANSKIKDLEETTNDFLDSIGSDLRVQISGFTKVKNKIREKISVKLLRDGLDAGSFGKFSGGEQARISLACILALSKLINLNCDPGKGLDLLILDEILEAVDESGLACMLKALNESKMTCMVVSHGLIAENYEYRQIVIKENGESNIYNK